MVPSASTSKIPALLQPFLLHHRHSQHNQEDGGAPSSDGQLVLLTSVLGASANWLVLRWLYALLLLLLPPRRDVSLPVGGDAVPVGDDGGGGGGSAGDGHNDGMAVVLCSFLRDGAFWREGAAKMVNINIFRFLLFPFQNLYRLLLLFFFPLLAVDGLASS